ncbi:putative structural protein [phage 023Pt_psg01]|nr:putative structural protein [phage 023Pt_psg01]
MTSKIKVDNINKVSDDSNIIKKCGTTTTIGSGASNPIVVDGSAVTLGRCGGTVALASGATQTGFGRTGTVDWQTTPKTATFTAANGEGYFANTSGGAFTMNLPAGSAGAIVSVADYTNTFQTNALTVSPNGSEKIGGVAATQTLTTEGQSVTFVYVDGTEGWKNVHDSTSNVTGNPFIQATGGTITTSGNCKIHTFTGPGTFCVSSISQTAPQNVVSYMVVAGGGGQTNIGHYNGGGGAGGFREVKAPDTPYTASPLDGYPSAPNRITVTATSFPITVGGGGTGGPGPSGCGSNSVFSTITSTGGGGGGSPALGGGQTGGSGGGGSTFTPASNRPGSAGNTPPVSPPQGNSGGIGKLSSPPGTAGSGGGGGATAAGGNSNTSTPITAGNGGAGATTSISGSPTAYAGGGGGSAYLSGAGGSGGSGGGGNGGQYPNNPAATNGTANTGGGAGGDAGFTNPTGGSGIVIIRYKFQ